MKDRIEELKNIAAAEVVSHMPELKKIRDYLYQNPEVGGTEEKAEAILTKTYEEHGFEVTRDFHKIPYCFRALYDSGKPAHSQTENTVPAD